MNYSISRIPIFERLKESKSILLAGAGGGFDIYAGIPLYFNLKQQGKRVVLANYSFTWLAETSSENVFPFCYKINVGDSDFSGRNYFPEKYLKLWLSLQGETVDVYGFERTGVKPLRNAYNYLIDKYDVDTIILVDGGTDSLMFGDEDGLGTPQEDVCSMAAVHRSKVKNNFLVSIGFGIDDFHGVSHYRFLENVAAIAKGEGYLGCFQITKEMEEARKYMEAVEFANEKMNGMESIVSNSIISALAGEYGDHHSTQRKSGSELWINPLMSMSWCFELKAVIRKIKYYEAIKDVHSVGEFNAQLVKYRNQLEAVRGRKKIPL